MYAIAERDQFAPPIPPARMRSVALAVLAHALLLGALTWGVHWKTSASQPAVEAELWAVTPQQAAPPSPLPPKPTPEPPQPQPPRPQPQVQQPDTHEADIALELKKKRLEEEKRQREEQLARERAEKERLERLAREEQEARQKAAQDKQKADEAAAKKKQAEDAALAKKLREDQMRRIAAMAGATGNGPPTGTAQHSAGPSGSYAGKIVARVRPNIFYPDPATINGNPRTEVRVRVAPDGAVISATVSKSSGNRAWDDAVQRAVLKTGKLPLDTDGSVQPDMFLDFSPQD